MGGFAWVTLATNDSYSLGALVLAHSLRRVGTKHDLAVLITPGVTQPMREKLSSVFSLVQEVNVLDSRDEANLALLARPELGITFTKLHCWRLTQYEKCVFVDADTLVVRNCDELFEREELSAAPDVGWPDCFNSGVFVFTPSQQTFASLTAFAASKGSFDGGDQGLLNMYFSDWAHKDISKHLPFIYNMCSTATYSYLPAYKQFGEDVRIIHFIGSTKPWLQYYDTLARQVQPAPGMNHIQPLLQLWWNIFCDDVHPELSPVMASTTLAPHWHEYLLPMSSIPMNTRHHSFHDSTDQTYDEIDHVQSYFSEFRDPWENYIAPIIYSQQMCSNDPSKDTQDHLQQVNLHQSPPQIENFQVFHPSNATNIDTSQVNIPSNYHYSASAHAQPSHYEKASLSSQSEHQTHQNPNFSVDQSQNQKCSDSSSSVNFQSNHSSTQTHHDTHSNHQQRHPENINHQNHELHSEITYETEREDQQSRDEMDLSDNNCRLLDRLTDQSINDENSQNEGVPLQSHSQTCNESENISTHSNVNTSEIDNSNSGIAGALAQLTLGEARNPEQVALEEHMRKCGWEQGQIDYMGRDSFDNIWKKICGTLDAAPLKRDTTPPKEKSPELVKEPSPVLSTSETAAAATTEKEAAAAEEAVPLKPDAITEFQRDKLEQEETQITEQTSKNIQTQMSLEEMKEASVPTIQQSSSEKSDILRLTAPPPVLSLTTSPPILSLTTSPPILSIKEAGEKYKQLEKSQTTAESAELNKKPTETVIPLGFTSPTTYESTTSLDLAASQSAPTDSQVPIQVAESVLEADIKEIVTEDMKPVTEEAISSVSAPIQESVSAVVETLEAAVPAQAPPLLERVVSQPNGNAGFDSDIKSDEDVPVSRVSTASAAVGTAPAPILESPAHQAVPGTVEAEKPVPEQLPPLVPEQLPTPVPEQLPKPVSEQLSTPVSEQLPKPVSEQLPSPVPEQLPTAVPEQLPTAVQPVSPPAVTEKATKAAESPSSPKPPPSAKIQIPGTPTITEATPPTSPQFELAETQPSKSPPKTTKRVIKKTSSDEKTESSEADEVKKPVKKVIKKIVKKPKEGQTDGAEGSSTSAEKPKKIVKVVKKSTKPSETLSTDSSVPETPPPVSSEAPVPPKRKAKPSTTKTAVKKPDEQ